LRRIALSLALGTALACGGKRPPSLPSLFPLTSVWTAQLGEGIEGDLASDGPRIYLTTRAGTVRAFEQATGREAWRAEGPRRSLSARAGAVVVRGLDGTTESLDPADGRTRWTTSTGVKGDLAPAFSDDLVYVAGEGLVALEVASGRTAWSASDGGSISAPPVVIGSCLLTGENDGVLRCRDPRSGASRWTFHTGSALLAPPAPDRAGHLVLGTTDRRILSLDPEKGKQRWQWKVGADVERPAAALGDRVFVAGFDAVLYALHAKNGNLAWRTPLPSRPLSGPIVTRGLILVACHENEILGFEPRAGKRVGGLKTRELLRTAPLLRGDRLFVALRDRSLEAMDMPGALFTHEDETADPDATSEAPPKP
jgi:outer membrane protein assembly factor BamB